MVTNFEEVLVDKPWGYEYLCYRNEVIAIWFLFIKHGHRTSLHCYPNKHTGLVVVQGSVTLRFLRGETELVALDKIHIFRSRFHSSQATSEDGACVLEIETPEDKHDLVRLDDTYGRSGQQYEGPRHYKQKREDAIRIREPNEGGAIPVKCGACNVRHFEVNTASDLLSFSDSEVIVIVRGGLSAGINARILWPGDVIDGSTLQRLALNFEIIPYTTVLHIRQDITQ